MSTSREIAERIRKGEKPVPMFTPTLKQPGDYWLTNIGRRVMG